MEELKNKFKNVIIAAQPLLAQGYSVNPQYKAEAVIEHVENNSIRTQFTAVPDYTQAMFDLRESLPLLPEVKTLLDYVIANDNIAASILVDAAGQRLPANDTSVFFSFTVWPFLGSYLNELTTLDGAIDNAVFDHIFKDLRKYIQSTQTPLIYEAPIIGLKSGLNELKFSKDVWIRSRTDDDIKRVSKPYMQFDPRHNEVSFNSYFLVIRTYTNKNDSMSVEPAMKIADEVLSAFRLYKDGQIYLGSNRQYAELKAGPSQWVSQSNSSDFRAGDYSLKLEDVESIKNLYMSSKKFRDERWQLALRRLNLTYDRKQAEDRLIDCWVGLETLLLSDSSDGELRFKASLRLSKFIGENKDERLEIKKDTKKSYNRRSEVVHGMTPLKPDLPEVTDKTIVLLRRALLRWLDKEHSHLIDAIDASLLD